MSDERAAPDSSDVIIGGHSAGKSLCQELAFTEKIHLIILLSAPAGVLAQRLAARTASSFGKVRGELARVLDALQAVEPLLRKAATHEIRTTRLSVTGCLPGQGSSSVGPSEPAPAIRRGSMSAWSEFKPSSVHEASGGRVGDDAGSGG